MGGDGFSGEPLKAANWQYVIRLQHLKIGGHRYECKQEELQRREQTKDRPIITENRKGRTRKADNRKEIKETERGMTE